MKKNLLMTLLLLFTCFVFIGCTTSTTRTTTATTTTTTTTTTTSQVSVVISFLSNGGSTVSSITQYVGTTLTAPADPTRTGYTFGGWYTDNGTFNNLFVFSTMPSANVSLSAKWTINQYAVEYVDHDGTVLQTANYAYGASLTNVTAPVIPTRTGYTFASWSGTVPATMGTAKVTLTATYTINQYAVEYVDHDGTVLQTANYAYGASLTNVTAPVIPTRTGFTFASWSGTVPATMGTAKVTLTATYTINQYAVEYVDHDGTVLQTANYAYGASLTNVTAPVIPTRTGYTFASWSGTVPATMGTAKVTLTATYTITQYTISFNSQGGSDVLAKTQNYDTNVTAPANPTKLGMTFAGWYTDEALTDFYTFVTMPANDLILYADWGTAGLAFGSDEDGYYVYAGTSDDENIIIPNRFGGQVITKIKNEAFMDYSNIVTITMPSSIISIGDSAFKGCSNLTGITLTANIISIGASAFYHCESLTDITIPMNVVSIGDSAFSRCDNLVSITFASGSLLTTIGNSAFADCAMLSSITIPEFVNVIGDYAFSYSNLTSILVDENNASFSSEAGVLFDKTKTLLIVYPYGNTASDYHVLDGVTTIYASAFDGCVILTSLTIPASVTTIGEYAFTYCTGLTSILFEVGSQLVNISSYAFSFCESLLDITLPASLTSLGIGAFSNCTSMTMLVFADNIQLSVISDQAFYQCDNLLHVIIPANVLTIANSAFASCSSLITITFESGSHLEMIDADAFSNCRDLHTITLPASLTNFNSSAVRGCENLSEILVEAANNNYMSENGVLFNKTKTVLIAYPMGILASAYTIPADVFSIGDRAFYECINLTSVTLASSVTSIGYAAFYGCTGLTSITTPSGLERIGADAFYGCLNLTSILIPSTVTFIGTTAFYYHLPHSLTIYVVSSSQSGSWDSSWNHGGGTVVLSSRVLSFVSNGGSVVAPIINPAGAAVTTPAEPTKDGKIFLGWYTDDVTFLNSYPISLMPSTDLVLYAKWGNTITFNTNGGSTVNPMTGQSGESVSAPADPTRPNYAFSGWFSDETLLTPYVFSVIPLVNETVYAGWYSSLLTFTLIDGGTHYSVSRGTATGDIVIPATYLGLPVTMIANTGFDRFGQSWAFTSLTIPEGITTIGTDAFNGIPWISVTLPSTLVTIGSGAFTFNQNLLSIHIPANVHTIGSQALSSATGLTTITVAPENEWFTSIDGALFNHDMTTLICLPGGYNATTYTVPAGVTTIGAYAIKSVFLLQYLVLQSGVTTLNYNSISSCSNLVSIIIPLSVITVANSIVFSCPKLIVHIEAESPPAGWSAGWNGGYWNGVTVLNPEVWGYIIP